MGEKKVAAVVMEEGAKIVALWQKILLRILLRMVCITQQILLFLLHDFLFAIFSAL